MQVISKIEEIPVDNLPNIVALGNFDGVHLGHQKLIETLVSTAKEMSGRSIVFSFEPHPAHVLNPDTPLPLLTNPEEKRQRIEALGVDYLLLLPFNKDFAGKSAEQFITEVLVNSLHVKGVIVGHNYSFGRGGQGTSEMLQEYGIKLGFIVKILSPVYLENTLVSSTIIREIIQLGEVDKAIELLGRPTSYSGTIVKGQSLGSTIGFPTANLNLDYNYVLPAKGVYVIRAIVDNHLYGGVANIGNRPTVQVDGKTLLEVHLFDFNKKIYGQQIRVEFLQRLRLEKKFGSIEELASQIAVDIAKAREILNESLPLSVN